MKRSRRRTPTVREAPWFEIAIPFLPLLIADLKARPVRAYDPTDRTWWFPGDDRSAVLGILRRHGIEPRTIAAEPPRTAYSVLGVLETAPTVVIQAAWRALSRVFHPDAGGDEEAFKALEVAYSTIMDERSDGGAT